MARTPRAGGDRQRPVLVLLALALSLAAAPVCARQQPAGPGPEPLTHRQPVWYAADDAPIPVPEPAEPGLVPYAYQSFVARPFSRFFHPGRFVRWIGGGDRAAPAADINALDEVVNSTWFTNRMGLFELSDAQLVTGPGQPEGPDRSAPWVIVGAKTSGVTPGFRIRDGRGVCGRVGHGTIRRCALSPYDLADCPPNHGCSRRRLPVRSPGGRAANPETW